MLTNVTERDFFPRFSLSQLILFHFVSRINFNECKLRSIEVELNLKLRVFFQSCLLAAARALKCVN